MRKPQFAKILSVIDEIDKQIFQILYTIGSTYM